MDETEWDGRKWWVSERKKLTGYLRWVINFWTSEAKQCEETMAKVILIECVGEKVMKRKLCNEETELQGIDTFTVFYKNQ